MRQDPDVDDAELPRTGTCDLSTVGRRTGHSRRVEIWYVVVDGRIVVTGTPGARHWLANLRERPAAVLHLRGPDRDVTVTAEEVTDEAARRRVAAEAWRLQPWYAEQPYSVEDWVADSPMVMLTPAASDPGGAGREC
jgi:deazaflavin-dependent oxidoreductase (nitroreductase family)